MRCTDSHLSRREFKSKDAAGQLDASPYEFSHLSASSPLVWLANGFAVLSGPSMPIVAEGDEEPNDTYVAQLVGALLLAAMSELTCHAVHHACMVHAVIAPVSVIPLRQRKHSRHSLLYPLPQPSHNFRRATTAAPERKEQHRCCARAANAEAARDEVSCLHQGTQGAHVQKFALQTLWQFRFFEALRTQTNIDHGVRMQRVRRPQ